MRNQDVDRAAFECLLRHGLLIAVRHVAIVEVEVAELNPLHNSHKTAIRTLMPLTTRAFMRSEYVFVVMYETA